MRILQCLNWDLKVTTNTIEQIKKQGFDTIQITPVQPLKESSKDNWWLCYQPCAFQIGNQYGSKEDLIALCKKAHEYDIKVIVDVICTHVAQGKEMIPHELVDQELKENPHIWREKKNLQGDWDYNNRYNVTHYCAGNLPGLNLYNWDLQDIIIRFLNECIDCGVDGFRFDSGKSIPLPTDKFEEERHLKDSRPCDFFPRVLSSLKRQDLTNYIEVLNTDPKLIEQYSKFGMVLTDVETEWLDKEKMITFAESHDQYFNWRPQVISPLSDQTVSDWYKRKNNYYPNTLFYARPFSNEWQSENVRIGNLENNKTKKLERLYY